MQYELECECGKMVPVQETAAGGKERCGCGRILDVPSLRELRHQAGLPGPSLSPEMVLETLLVARKLPGTDRCVLCGVATDGVIICTTVCERAYVASGRPPWWLYAAAFLSFGLIGVAVTHASAGEDKEWGRDRVFPLPLPVCAACRPRLTGPEELRAALDRVPAYRPLLEKYPFARVTLSA